MILTPNFSRFRTSEFIQFFSDAETICLQNKPAELNIKPQLDSFTEAKAACEQTFKKISKSDITAKLAELDKSRDEALVCIKTVSEGNRLSIDANKRAAAENISTCISKYGSRIYDLNYQAETSIISSLSKELKNGLAESVALLHLSSEVEHLHATNLAFSETFIDRIEEKASDNKESTSALIKSTSDKYKILCKHIEAHATIAPSEQYGLLIDQLNALISRYNSTMALRTSAA